jgi:DNA helicase-2/ATP-dependent DNA helicase PcrA
MRDAATEEKSLFDPATSGEEDWNEYQERIFDWTRAAARGRAKSPHAVIRARAGTGKTTTATKMADIISEESPTSNALFATFSKGISEEISGELEGTRFDARTMHSLGYGAARRGLSASDGDFDIYKFKYLDIIDDWARHNYRGHGDDAWYNEKWDMHSVVGICRNLLADPEDEDDLADAANLVNVPLGAWSDGVADVIEMGKEAADKDGLLDFTDMVYLPVAMDCPFSTYDWIIVDEAQDLNPAQQEIVDRLVSPTGHSVWVGDANQSIFQFQGAKPSGFLSVPDRYDAEVFELPVSYRCPSSHVREAQRIVPDIESAESAGEGTIEKTSPSDFFDKVRPGDMVLSRRNAPTMKKAIGLLNRQRPAKIVGKSLESKLTRRIDKITDRMAESGILEEGGRKRMATELKHKDRPQDFAIDYEAFGRISDKFHDEKTRRLSNQGASEDQIEIVIDEKECIRACYERFEHASNPAELKSAIRSLFKSDREPVRFSTIHKAKGKEFERVHVIDSGKLPMEFDWGRPPGEMNLKYVCLTRSSSYINVFGDLWGEREGVSLGASKVTEEYEEATGELKQKIVQLLNKARSTSFEPEAETFRLKAEELMEEYDLSRDGLAREGYDLREA